MFIGLIGPGLVGKEVLNQIKSYQDRSLYPPLKILGICSSKVRLHGTHSSPIPLLHWHELFSGKNLSNYSDMQREESGDIDLFVAELYHLCLNHSAPLCIVDCTSSQFVANKYPSWLEKGIHIVTPNKKAFSSELGLWKLIQELTKKKPGGYPMCLHESTVGAGLPVLSTLKDLISSGDEIVSIEGILSGTLSFLFNEFSSPDTLTTASFSEMVKKAKELGYTEPDPREDLNGFDVARKVVILSRIAGINISLSDLNIVNLVPEPLRSIDSIEKFMTNLPAYDSEFTDINNEAKKESFVLRYVGIVTPGKCEVKIQKYPFSHPFAQLKGSDNIIAFTTKRFSKPLIVQGAGAGAAVTAHGVTRDLLKIAECVHYNDK